MTDRQITLREGDALASMMAGMEERIEHLEAEREIVRDIKREIATLQVELKSMILQAGHELRATLPSPEELEWLRLACKRAAKEEEFRSAVIEKSTVGVVLMLLGIVAGSAWYVLKDFFTLHGWKP